MAFCDTTDFERVVGVNSVQMHNSASTMYYLVIAGTASRTIFVLIHEVAFVDEGGTTDDVNLKYD